MKVTREQAAQNRERVLEAAGRLFRERGFEGIGVADLMKAAGLTHGAFYGQFESKEHLIAQACERALMGSSQKWDRLLEGKKGDQALKALRAHYLSRHHVENPQSGCALAALAAEAARRDAPVRRVFTEGANRLVERIASLLPVRSKPARRREALATLAGLVGALVLARAVDDPALSAEILAAVRDA
jgi:TetR/AcrR family transcriptional regulator, transcriptional repressor for nem operon